MYSLMRNQYQPISSSSWSSSEKLISNSSSSSSKKSSQLLELPLHSCVACCTYTMGTFRVSLTIYLCNRHDICVHMASPSPLPLCFHYHSFSRHSSLSFSSSLFQQFLAIKLMSWRPSRSIQKTNGQFKVAGIRAGGDDET